MDSNPELFYAESCRETEHFQELANYKFVMITLGLYSSILGLSIVCIYCAMKSKISRIKNYYDNVY